MTLWPGQAGLVRDKEVFYQLTVAGPAQVDSHSPDDSQDAVAATVLDTFAQDDVTEDTDVGTGGGSCAGRDWD